MKLILSNQPGIGDLGLQFADHTGICEFTSKDNSRERHTGDSKLCGAALLGDTSLVPVDDVDELPRVFAELNLQLALFVDD
jgi:hypothetical protein